MVDALKESLTVKYNNSTYIPHFSHPLFWLTVSVLIGLDWLEITLLICLRLVLELKDVS